MQYQISDTGISTVYQPNNGDPVVEWVVRLSQLKLNHG
jgi:hypothetical protein